MKAETRKHLEQNSLAEQMNKLMHGGVKSPSVVWILLGVAIVLGVLYWWLTGTMATRAADSWAKLWLNQNQGIVGVTEVDLKNTAAELGGDLLGADSQFDLAQMTMMTDPRLAQSSFEGAAAKYVAAANKAAAVPELQLRAFVGAAKCYETIGNLDQAVTLYKSASAAAERGKLSGHPLLLQAQKRVELLASAKSEGREFYTGWPNRLPKSVMERPTDRPTPPPMPTMPGLIDPKATATTPGTFVPPTATTPAASAPNVAAPMPPPVATTPSASAPAATKPAETKPTPTKPAETKPSETKPVK